MKKILRPISSFITQYFGENFVTDYGVKAYVDPPGHPGLDFGCLINTPVLACDDGIVINRSDRGDGYGKLVILLHDWGISLYGHNSNYNINIGDSVEVGDVISFSGNTGFSTGPHVHFEIQINGRAIDPLPYLTINISEVQMITYADVDRCFWAITRNAPNAEAYRHYVDSGEFQGDKVDMWADVADSPQHTLMYDQAQLYINGGVSGYEEVTEKLYRKK